MNSPRSTVRVLKRPITLEFETILKNSRDEEIAGFWFTDGAWRMSTQPLLRFSTKVEALEAWKSRFNHDSALPLPCPHEIICDGKSEEPR